MSYELPPIVGGCMVKGTEDEANMGLREEFARMRAETERLRKLRAEIDQLRAEGEISHALIERLRALVKDLADDLEGELRGHPRYGPVMDYPSEKRRFERAMANVYEARRALETLSIRTSRAIVLGADRDTG